ncbi:MAG: phasin family protein, partial [Sphingomonadaceae bacterium]
METGRVTGTPNINVVDLKPSAKRVTKASRAQDKPTTAKPAVAMPDIPETIRKELTMNAETVLKSLEAITPAVEKVTADALAQGKANLETVVEKGQEMMGTAVKSVSDMSEFAKGNVEAMMASAKVATAGAETIANMMVEHSKKSFEEATAAMKAMAAAKS